jgi:hypothetical protein
MDHVITERSVRYWTAWKATCSCGWTTEGRCGVFEPMDTPSVRMEIDIDCHLAEVAA